MTDNQIIGTTLTGLIVVALISIFAIFSEKVPAGYEAILVNQYSQDKVDDNARVTGRVWYNPMTQDLVQYPNFVQTIDYEPFQVQAKDGQLFTVDPNIAFRINPGDTPKIYEKYRKDIESLQGTVVLQFVKDAFRTIMNKYTTDEVLYNREKIDEEIMKVLHDTAGANGFNIEQVTSGLQYPQSLINAIEAKNQAVQNAQKVENEVKIAEANAKIEITKAEAEAKVRKINAESQAESLLIQSEAEAKANEMKKAQLNDLLIKQQFIEKWNGQLPTYGEAPSIIKSVQ